MKTRSLVLILLSLTMCLANPAELKFLSQDRSTVGSLFNIFKGVVSTMSAYLHYNKETESHDVVIGAKDDAAATIIYEKTLEAKGWDTLTIKSYAGADNKFTDEEKAYQMGFLEGHLTASRIDTHYVNLKKFLFSDNNGVMPDNVREYFRLNNEWIDKMTKENKDQDEFWYQAFTIQTQLKGLVDGYNAARSVGEQLTMEDVQVMNANGDIGEVGLWKSKSRPNFTTMSVEQIRNFIDDNSHCSALIKVAADFSDVWFGHNTWTTFSSMTRIFKTYSFTSNKDHKTKSVAFSSYPGTTNSIDDFYILHNDLYVVETTNQIFKPELYDLLTPESLLTWMRTMIAHRLSDDGETWTKVFARYNSGTYNNQFQILNLNLIDTENRVIHDNALWIIEQIPGYTEAEDMTRFLRYGYWPSYNSAYFATVREKSGYNEIVKQKPELRDVVDYSTCVRANIFRRDQGNVKSLADFKKLLRYNDYQHDPLSKNNPTFAIACRKDLFKDSQCIGATDAKVASIHDIKGKSIKKVTAVSGPTSDIQAPFNTVTSQCLKAGKYSFNGLPEVFNFPWVEFGADMS